MSEIRDVQELPGSALERFSNRYTLAGRLKETAIRLIAKGNDELPNLIVSPEAELFVDAFLASDEPDIPMSVMVACCRDSFFADAVFLANFPRISHRAWDYIEGMLQSAYWEGVPTQNLVHPQPLTFERDQERSAWSVDSDEFIGIFLKESSNYSVMSMADLRAKYMRTKRLFASSVPDSIILLVSYMSHTTGASFYTPLLSATQKCVLSPEYFKWLIRGLSFHAHAAPSAPDADTDPTYREKHQATHLSLPLSIRAQAMGGPF